MRKPSIVVATLALTFAAAACAQVGYRDRPPPQYQSPYPPDQRGYPPGRYGRPGHDDRVVSCGSPQYRMIRCATPRDWRGARIVRQTSHTQCVEGRNWGFDRGGIWVDEGCGGEFMAAAGWRPGPDWNRDFMVSCGSPQYRYYFCQVDVGPRGRVILQHQYSDSACIEGRSWGWNRAGIWVDKGCGGHFLVTRRW